MSGWGWASRWSPLVTYAFILPDTGATKKATGEGWHS